MLNGFRVSLAARMLFGAAMLVPAGGAIAAGSQASVAFAHTLPNVPGKTLTAAIVSYPPGAKSAEHHHAGTVFAYVLSGAVRSQNSATGPARVYRAGESFFEPPSSTHLISENASLTEPASLLAIFVADDGAVLTKPGPAQ